MSEEEQAAIEQFNEAFRALLQNHPKITMSLHVDFPNYNMANLPQEVSYCLYLLKKYNGQLKAVYTIKK